MKRREGLFSGFWTDLDGKRLGRIQRSEYPELYRLWREHRDIREGWARELRPRRRRAA